MTTEDRCSAGCVTELIPTLIANIMQHKSITEPAGHMRTFRPDSELRFLIHFVGEHSSTPAYDDQRRCGRELREGDRLR